MKTKTSTLAEVDALMSADLWSEHPANDREGWRQDVADGNTQLGYWDWVKRNIEMEEPAL